MRRGPVTIDNNGPLRTLRLCGATIPYRVTFGVPAWEMAALALIVLVGLGVRLLGLTSYAIWFDEGYHIALVKLPGVPAMLDAVLSNPPSDPLYVLLLRGWVGLFGHGDVAVRGLSVLLSVCTLPITYWLGRIVAYPAVGLLGALLFALAPYAVELGQEAALYTLAALATTAALAAGWRWLMSGRGALLYVALGIVAVYSHYVVAAILALFAAFAAFAVYPVGVRRVRIRAWVMAHIAIFAAWLPWLVALALHLRADPVPRVTLTHVATWGDIVGALVQYTSGTVSLQSQNRVLEALGLLGGLLLLLLGLFLAGRHHPALRLLVALSAIIFFAPALVSALTGLWLFVPHFMLLLLPSLMVALAAGGLALAGGRLVFGKALVAALIGLWLGVQLVGLTLYYRQPPHGADGLRELATVLRDGGLPTDVVLVMPPALVVTLQQYYPGRVYGLPSDFDLRAVYLPYEPVSWNQQALAALENRVAVRGRFWLVYRPELDDKGMFLRAVQDRYRQEVVIQYEYATLYRFSR